MKDKTPEQHNGVRDMFMLYLREKDILKQTVGVCLYLVQKKIDRGSGI